MIIVLNLHQFIMDDLDYKLRTKEGYSKRALFWIEKANQQLSEISKQLLVLAIFLLPLTASVVVTSVKLSESQKTFLKIGWAYLLLSIVSGLWQYFIDAKYFKDLSRDSSRREQIWSDLRRSRNQMEQETKDLGKVPEQSTFFPLTLQALSLAAGIILIIFVASTLLV